MLHRWRLVSLFGCFFGGAVLVWKMSLKELHSFTFSLTSLYFVNFGKCLLFKKTRYLQCLYVLDMGCRVVW